MDPLVFIPCCIAVVLLITAGIVLKAVWEAWKRKKAK